MWGIFKRKTVKDDLFQNVIEIEKNHKKERKKNKNTIWDQMLHNNQLETSTFSEPIVKRISITT